MLELKRGNYLLGTLLGPTGASSTAQERFEWLHENPTPAPDQHAGHLTIQNGRAHCSNSDASATSSLSD
jgi:hypothetical protein